MNNAGATFGISSALQIFFGFVDGRQTLEQELPPNVSKAFREIMAYYTPRLAAALQLDPNDRLFCPDHLFNYGWTQLWKFSQNLTRNRSVAGVFAWLKRTLSRRQSEIFKFYALERKLMLCLDVCLNDGGGFSRHADDFMDAELQNPQFEKIADAKYRFHLLDSYYRAALARLNQRQQQAIKLGKLHAMFQHYRQDFNLEVENVAPRHAGQTGYLRDPSVTAAWREKEDYCSLAEMKELMGFRSLDAAKAFKRRALKALIKELSRLFKRELNQAGGDWARREILEEWIERHCESRQALNF